MALLWGWDGLLPVEACVFVGKGTGVGNIEPPHPPRDGVEIVHLF